MVDGTPRLADGQRLEVAVVVWATNYRPDFGWIDLPIFNAAGAPPTTEAWSPPHLACTSWGCPAALPGTSRRRLRQAASTA